MNQFYKHLLLLFVATGCFAFGKSQSYAPFPMTSAAWGQVEELYTFPNGPSQFNYQHFFLNGDTLVNGHVYTRLFFDYGTLSNGIDTANAQICGAIREDTSKKVYFLRLGTVNPSFCPLPPTQGQEYLMYDFGAAVGDTFYTENGAGQLVNTVVATGVDTLFGVPRRWINIQKGYAGDGLWYTDQQYEGVGSVMGVTGPYCTPFEEGYQLLCFEDSTISWGGCFLASISDGLSSEFALQVGPNPIEPSSKLVIETTLSEPFDLEVIDLQGRTLLQTQLRGGQPFPIGSQGLPSGMYLLKASQNGEPIASKKLLVR